jgi:thymidylate kinase
MGKIIAIEGFWRIGKTSLCKSLFKRIKKAKYIHEPDHLKLENRPGDVEYWYLKKWKEKMEIAKKHKAKGYNIIMERTFISTMAFNNALGRKVTKPMEKLIKYHKQNLPDIVVILEAPHLFLEKIVFGGTDKKILKTRALYRQKKFLHKYTRYFNDLIINLEVNNFTVQVANTNGFYAIDNIVNEVIKKLKERASLQ